MKKTFFLFVMAIALSAFHTEAWSQEHNPVQKIDPDSRLVEAFGQSFADRLVQENSNLLVYYNFFLDNSYYITELPDDKADFFESLTKLPIAPDTDPKNINVLKYEIKLKFDKETYFRMSDSNKVMVFYSGEKLNEKYNEHRRALGLVTETPTN
ncbi:MAG: hypothetical protein K9H64_03335 [Bacteroidales bacterium]|nr:hypothetical protein [Bacteroidales bacterium]MCF8454424.1 hypothetical protein [Bacteroidales bacterium]